MLTTRELVVPKPSPRNYFERRMVELLESGKAIPRPRGPAPQRNGMDKALHDYAIQFAYRLKEARQLFVYWCPLENRCSFRKVRPGLALMGKRTGISLPSDAIFVGRYSHPHRPRAFVHDLKEAMREADE